jgi:hypothetical protein
MNDANTQPIEGGPIDGRVRAREPERAAFEAWASHEGYRTAKVPGGIGLDGKCVYGEANTHAAWLAWQAARPKRAAYGAIMNVAAALAQRKPIDAFSALEDSTHIGHRQFGRAYNRADEETRLLAVKLSDALRAL